MSRLEMNAEPSMEEILASIRKIIAEEPPGSRAVSSSARMGALSPATSARAGAPSPAPTPQRGFMSREAFMRSSAPPEPDDNAPVFTPPTSQPSSEASGAVESSISATAAEQKSSETSAPSKDANGHDTSSAERSLNPKNAIGPACAADPEENSKAASAPEPEAKSIEAQLADLLGDELQALNGAQHGDADAGIATSFDVDAGSVAIEEPAAPEPRPGFTVSRIGFTNGSAETGEGGDPFAFDLGPSPFSSHSPEEFSAELQKPEFESSSKKPLRIESKPSAGDGESASTPAATDKTSAPAPAAQTNELFAVPSVAATLGPHRTLEPLSAAFQPTPFERGSSEYRPSEEPSFEHRSYERQSFENRSFENRPFGNRTFGDRLFENHQANTTAQETASESENARNSSVRAEFRGERLERMLQPAPIEEAVPDRLMEDAMADLLRPLLRTWLAENMPKIVERALRREMTERLLPGQKGPFD
jgi:cell pole-organizing protein PopZ